MGSEREETALKDCSRDIKIELPEDVRFIIEKLGAAGHEAYAVGGCVRDSLLRRKPEDWDITTDALPGEVKGCFKKTVDTGLEHGTVTVILKDKMSGGLKGYEVTTYRIDGEYRDGRHPEGVTFTPSLWEDLKRRDFTVNAMAYNEDAGLVDEFSGLSDLKDRVIRCVGDPDDRFDEDALRILRAVRFAAQLGFSVEKNTEEAIRRHSANLGRVSKERIQAELTKLLCSDNPGKVSKIKELGMGPYICDGFEDINILNFKETAEKLSLGAVGKEEKYLRYALLLGGADRRRSQSFLKGLKLDNNTVKKASILSEELLKPLETDRYSVKKHMQKIGRELFSDLVKLKLELKRNLVSFYSEQCKDEDIESVSIMLEDINKKEEPVFLGELAVTGKVLMELGIKEGPELGRLLNLMMEDVLKDPGHNDRVYLTETYCKKDKSR